MGHIGFMGIMRQETVLYIPDFVMRQSTLLKDVVSQ